METAEADRLTRESCHARTLPLRKELRAIRRRCAAFPVLDDRTPDEILGYDAQGSPAEERLV